MGGNPYARLLGLIRSEAPDAPLWMRRGTVVRRSPLTVSVAGLEQPAEALKLDRRLKSALDSELRGGVEETLRRGSGVLALTEDDQIFYILCEVVDA